MKDVNWKRGGGGEEGNWRLEQQQQHSCVAGVCCTLSLLEVLAVFVVDTGIGSGKPPLLVSCRMLLELGAWCSC